MSGAPPFRSAPDPDSPAGRIRATIHREWNRPDITDEQRGEIIAVVREDAQALSDGLASVVHATLQALRAERVN